MNKELEKEYLEDLDHYDEGMGIHSTSYEKCKERLIRLAKIDNANPSKALKCLERVDELQYIDHWESREKEIEIIEQALIKAQEQDKVLEIIKEKDVNFEVFGAFETYKDYEIYYNNKFHLIENKLTQEEFNLLKRWVR